MQDLKALGIIQNAQTSQRESLGTYKTLFPDWQMLPVKTNLDKTRAVLVFRKGNEQASVILSPAITELYRADKIGLNELAGLQVTLIDHNSDGETIPARLSLGMPAGWIAVADITATNWKPVTELQFEKLS